jgi:hypothetical protein
MPVVLFSAVPTCIGGPKIRAGENYLYIFLHYKKQLLGAPRPPWDVIASILKVLALSPLSSNITPSNRDPRMTTSKNRSNNFSGLYLPNSPQTCDSVVIYA